MKATFEADFSNFNSEVDKSVEKMKSIQKEANQVNVDMNKWVTEFSGQHVIEEANAIGLALTAIGGASKLTDDELKKVAATMAAAADRFLAFGKEVPPTMQVVIREIQAAQRAAAGFKAEVDSWAPALIKAKDAAAVLQTGGGAGGGAGAFAALKGLASETAGIAGEVGLWIAIANEVDNARKKLFELADWAKTNTAIPDLAAKWLGFGDVVKETAAAQEDAFYRMSLRTGQQITNQEQLNQALKDEVTLLEEVAAREAQNAAREQKRTAQLDRDQNTLQTRMRTEEKALADQQKREVDQAQQLHDREAMIFAQRSSAAAQRTTAIEMPSLGLDAQIAALQRLDAAEQQITRSVYDQISSETDRMKLIETYTQRHLELQAQIIAKEKEKAGIVNDAIMRELEARQRNMAAQGLTTMGMPKELAENPFVVLEKTLHDLDEQTQKGIRTDEQRNEATRVFTASLNAAAKANDDWINSLKPKTGMFESGEAITPWSTLAPKAIGVKPIGVRYAGEQPGAGGITAPTTVNVSGVLDPRTINELAAAVSKAIMSQLGRPTPNA